MSNTSNIAFTKGNNSLHSLNKIGCYSTKLGFPGGSDNKESTCNAGDPASIPGLGRSAGEGIGYPLQYFWAFLVAPCKDSGHIR